MQDLLDATRPTTRNAFATSTLPAIERVRIALNFYDYAGQDPINNYDLSGYYYLSEGLGEGGGGGGGLVAGGSDIEDSGGGAVEEELPGAPTGKTPSKIYYDSDYIKGARGRGASHIFDSARVKDVIENGGIGEYNPSPSNAPRPYVRYDLTVDEDGNEVTYEVGGYWTGNAFKVTHRLFK